MLVGEDFWGQDEPMSCGPYHAIVDHNVSLLGGGLAPAVVAVRGEQPDVGWARR